MEDSPNKSKNSNDNEVWFYRVLYASNETDCDIVFYFITNYEANPPKRTFRVRLRGVTKNYGYEYVDFNWDEPEQIPDVFGVQWGAADFSRDGIDNWLYGSGGSVVRSKYFKDQIAKGPDQSNLLYSTLKTRGANVDKYDDWLHDTFECLIKNDTDAWSLATPERPPPQAPSQSNDAEANSAKSPPQQCNNYAISDEQQQTPANSVSGDQGSESEWLANNCSGSFNDKVSSNTNGKRKQHFQDYTHPAQKTKTQQEQQSSDNTSQSSAQGMNDNALSSEQLANNGSASSSKEQKQQSGDNASQSPKKG